MFNLKCVTYLISRNYFINRDHSRGANRDFDWAIPPLNVKMHRKI